jgi:hypothetical protein
MQPILDYQHTGEKGDANLPTFVLLVILGFFKFLSNYCIEIIAERNLHLNVDKMRYQGCLYQILAQSVQ